MKSIVFTFLLLIAGTLSFGQRSSTYYKGKTSYSSWRKVASNAIFINGGGNPIPLTLYITGSIYYERIVYSKFPRPFVRAGYCSAYYIDRKYGYYMLQTGALFGRKASNFELAIGAMYNNETSEPDNSYNVSGSAGYRYHKPTGWLIFRVGVGIPELAYIGV